MKKWLPLFFMACTPNLITVPPANLKEYHFSVQDIANEAYYFLTTCDFFRLNSPEAAKILDKKKEFLIVVQEHPSSEVMAFYQKSTPTVIYVTPRFLAINDQVKAESIIAHEMMHLAGMHHNPGDMTDESLRREDPIYKTCRYCFPEFFPPISTDLSPFSHFVDFSSEKYIGE